MKKALLALVGLAVVGVIAFTINSLGHDAISDYINKKWPPVNVDQQRQQAIATAAQSLSNLTGANVAFGAEMADLEKAANTPALKALGVSRLRFRGEDQLVRIEADFDRRFEDDPAVDASARRLLQTLSPQITGSVLVYAGITSGTLATTPNTVELPLMILPAFKTVAVQRVVLTSKTDATLVGDLLANVLKRYADNVSGVLSRAPMMALKVPATFAGSVNPSQVIRIDSPDVKADVALGANTIHAPIKLLGIAWLITAKQLMALGAFVPSDNPVAQPGKTISPTYQDIKTQFEAMLAGAFDLPSKPSSSWFAIRKDLIALTANNAIRDAALSISGAAEMPQQRLNKEIAFPDETTVDCTPTRACDAERACNFPPNHDERGCNVCLLHNPFGGCILRGNDPVCETAKATQNKIYEADAAAKKFDCERLKAQEKGTCELEKTGQKALCETVRSS